MTWRPQFFTPAELTHSDAAIRAGIDNTPPPEIMARLEETALHMDRVRVFLSAPCPVSSGYRAPKVNKLVGGSKNSAHMDGYAIDFTCPIFGPPLAICKAIVAKRIPFDQLIQEGTWVHISFDPRMRGEVLTKLGNGYKEGL